MNDEAPGPRAKPTLDDIERCADAIGADYYEVLLAWANAARRGA